MRRKIQGKWQYQKIQPFQIDLQKNLTNLGITIFQLVDIGLLIGTDFFPGIQGIGPKKALQLIRKYKSFENINMKEYMNFDFKDLNPEIIKKVRKIFLVPNVNESVVNFYWNLPDKPRVLNLLCEQHYLNRNRVIKNLDKLEQNYLECRDYFTYQKRESKKIQLTIEDIL
jgi:flap endonuclease-1